MGIEKLFEEVIDTDDEEASNLLLDALLDHWVYFFFHETNGKDTKPGKENVDVVIFTGKYNPINFPMIENELGCNGAIYTNSELAISLAEFDCKVGKMRGKTALEMLYGIKDISGVYVQANYGNIHLNKAKIAELIGQNV
jgi:hypothetical protein